MGTGRRWSTARCLAGGQPARRRGEPVLIWGDARIGNIDVSRLRAGRRAGLGDGDARAARDWTWPGWSSPTASSRPSPTGHGAARHAGLPGGESDVRGTYEELSGVESRRPDLVPPPRRRDLGHRVHAHQRPADPLRRNRAAGRPGGPSSTTGRCSSGSWPRSVPDVADPRETASTASTSGSARSTSTRSTSCPGRSPGPAAATATSTTAAT